MSVLYGFSFSAEFINIFNVSFFTRYTMRTMYEINNNTSNMAAVINVDGMAWLSRHPMHWKVISPLVADCFVFSRVDLFVHQ